MNLSIKILIVKKLSMILPFVFAKDSIMVVEGTADDILKPEAVDKLRIRGITEGVPEVINH